MAKRRGFFKRASRSFGKSARRYSRSATSSSPMKLILPALAYGATRSWLAGMAQPLTSKLPLGGYADEALFGTAGYFMAKKGRGIVKQAGMAILIVEAASVGNQLAGGMMTNNASNSSTYVYG